MQIEKLRKIVICLKAEGDNAHLMKIITLTNLGKYLLEILHLYIATLKCYYLSYLLQCFDLYKIYPIKSRSTHTWFNKIFPNTRICALS